MAPFLPAVMAWTKGSSMSSSTIDKKQLPLISLPLASLPVFALPVASLPIEVLPVASLPIIPLLDAETFFSKENQRSWTSTEMPMAPVLNIGTSEPDKPDEASERNELSAPANDGFGANNSCKNRVSSGNLPQTLRRGFVAAGLPNETSTTHFAVALAYSGGLDSRLLALLLGRMGKNPLLFHIFGPQSMRGESLQALRWAHKNGFSTVCLPLNPLDIPEVRANGERRCYYCKRAMFSLIKQMSQVIAGEQNEGRLVDMPLHCDGENSPLEVHTRKLLLCDGTLASDLQTYRPGLQALRELGVVSPLALAGFDKKMVGLVAHSMGLERADQASQSCLLTRFGYGLPINQELLGDMAVADIIVKDFWEAYCQENSLGLVHQSLRLIDAQSLEWHIEGAKFSQEEEKALTMQVAKYLAGRIARKAPSLPCLRVRRVERVKGFFDRDLSR